MRNVTTYRICAGVCAAMILVGGLRNEISTVVLAGLGALYCLRWAAIERIAEEEREARRAFRNVVSLGPISHVRTVRPEPAERFEIGGVDLTPPSWTVRPRK